MASILGEAGAVTGYRERVYGLLRGQLAPLGPIAHAADVGAGEGWYARRLLDDGLVRRCDALEVVRRRHVLIEPILFDGERLPYAGPEPDLVYAIDVVHHARQPERLLTELCRVAKRWLLLKDHTHRGVLGHATLAVLDQIGNRRFGIASPGHYQRNWEWLPVIEAQGFRLCERLHPAPCERGLLGAVTNPLQFVALFERRVPA